MSHRVQLRGGVVALVVLLSGSFLHGEEPMTRPVVLRPVVSEEACPLRTIIVKTPDGQEAVAVVRMPPGEGAVPALVYLHGGLEKRPPTQLEKLSRENATIVRFLEAGYVTVVATFRSRRDDPQTADALVDCLAIIEYVRKMPRVDGKSIVVWGDSGGGSLALELAGETALAAVVAQEPATVLFTGLMTDGNDREKLTTIMERPKEFYTDKVRQFTRAKIAKISCPVLIVHGDKHIINRINHEVVIPEMKTLGKEPRTIFYPGEPHGFSRGSGSPAAAKKFFDDAHAFFGTHMAVQPKPLEPALVRHEAILPKALKDRPEDPSRE